VPLGAVNLNLGQRLKTFGAINRAITMQVSDILLEGVDADTAKLEMNSGSVHSTPSVRSQNG